ncbi:MAG: FAD-dependent oxidoreductase [Alphaproteobacteria bacterium]|jgi:dimethylglycine dehydrogenase|nr:glycine cleavage system protein T [Rhodospirillaceae bacterium]MDP6405326.1 FAD-dependent oxidoreductase [Alphaproteobacteria bacterium]MDP6620845.1 FAD-dependent oxidoreductase [Alphaproteobacteria bacterium]
MKSQARVVVIGGGVVGCSVLYHLARFGWSDVMLIERSELTSGSTWHAAGGFHTLNADPNIAALQGYTIRLYQELEELSEQSCGLHHVGGITIAGDPERLDYLKAERAKHRHMGLDTHMIGPDEIREICPVISVEGVLGALYDPLDGHLDPAGTTHAYAIAARRQGAEIVLRNRVLELNQKPDRSWDVVTEQGTVNAEYVVNAGGLWAREVGEMVGVYHPLIAMEHQYLVTDDIPEVYEREEELPHVVDPGAMTYFRQEGRGLVLGIYEQDCDPWSVERTPWDFGHELLPDNLERISGPLEAAFRRYPCLENAGIKRVINGPFTFAPDGNPLVGPVPGVPGYWCACAVMAGFSQGGGVGRTVAEWMIEGEPSSDVFAMDVARFGDWASRTYTQVKVVENYQRRFAVSFPNEELPAGRPLKATPAYGMWAAENAVFGAGYGLEHVNYFAPKGEEPFETPSFRRSNAFGPVGEECRAVRTAVGINEIHNFGKYEVSGPGADDWLEYLLANRMPAVGRIVLSPMLAPSGRLIGDLTVSRIAPERFQIIGSSLAQAFHMRWFESHLPEEGVAVRNISLERLGFQIAGPRARDLLASLTRSDVSNANLPFLGVAEMEVGLSPAIVCRISYTGDLGYEIYVAAEQQLALYHALTEAGREFGLRPFGMRAIMSLRLEKGFGAWLREYKPDYTPAETGLDRFVRFQKPDFIGMQAALTERETPPVRRLVTLVVDADDADVWADEPIWKDGEVVGFVTSGGYAHYVDKSVALGFVPTDTIAEGAEFEIEILGEMRPARLVGGPLFDPAGERLRS